MVDRWGRCFPVLRCVPYGLKKGCFSVSKSILFFVPRGAYFYSLPIAICSGVMGSSRCHTPVAR